MGGSETIGASVDDDDGRILLEIILSVELGVGTRPGVAKMVGTGRNNGVGRMISVDGPAAGGTVCRTGDGRGVA